MTEFNKHVGFGGPRHIPRASVVSKETLEYIQSALDELLELKETLPSIQRREVYSSTELVTEPQGDVLYLIGPKDADAGRYEEHVYLSRKKKFVKVGDVLIDLSGYVTTDALNEALAGYATSERLTEVNNDLQGQIDELAADIAKVWILVDPEVVLVGEESVVSFVASTNREATSIKITRDGTEVASGEGMVLSGVDTVTPSEAVAIGYQAEFIVSGFKKVVAAYVEVVPPVLYGAGQAHTDIVTKAGPRTSPVGTYNIEVQNDGDSVFFIVPRSMNIGNAKMNGFDFPLQAPVDVEIEGVEYKYYQSANTYNAGTLTIVIS